MSIKRVVALASIVGVLGLSTFFYMWWNGAPGSATSKQGYQTSTAVLGSETKLQAWQTGSFTTRFPDTLRVIRTDEIARAGVRGQYLLEARSLTQSDQLGITVGTLETSSLEDLPAVKLRRQQIAQYEVVTRSYAPEGALVFSSKDGYEVAVFWRSGKDYAAVVASGSISRQSILDYGLEAVVSNWQWQ